QRGSPPPARAAAPLWPPPPRAGEGNSTNKGEAPLRPERLRRFGHLPRERGREKPSSIATATQRGRVGANKAKAPLRPERLRRFGHLPRERGREGLPLSIATANPRGMGMVSVSGSGLA